MNLGSKISAGLLALSAGLLAAPAAHAVVVEELPGTGLIPAPDSWHTAYQVRQYADLTDHGVIPISPYTIVQKQVCEIILPGASTGTCWQQRPDGTWVSMVKIPVSTVTSIEVYPIWEGLGLPRNEEVPASDEPVPGAEAYAEQEAAEAAAQDAPADV